MTSRLDRYEVTDHEGEKVVVVNPTEMSDIGRVVNAAERIAERWMMGLPLDQRQMRTLCGALGDLGDWG